MNLPSEFLDYTIQYQAQNALPAYVPGKEIGYDQIVSTVNVTGGSSGAATTVISGTPHSFAGETVILEFFTPAAVTPSAAIGSTLSIGLFESGVLVSLLTQLKTPAAANMTVTVLERLRFTPSVGTHTYVIGAWASSTTGTPQIVAGTGSSGGFPPAYMRITKV